MTELQILGVLLAVVAVWVAWDQGKKHGQRQALAHIAQELEDLQRSEEIRRLRN